MMKKQLLFCAICLALVSCKTDEWIDWKTQNEVFMLENANKDGVMTTPSGLQYTILYAGNESDAKPNSTSTVVCDYKLELINGYVVESNNNAYLTLSSLISGFVEGIRKIHVHGDIVLYIPWDLAYGSEGRGSDGYDSYVPPYSTLIYTIHLSMITN